MVKQRYAREKEYRAVGHPATAFGIYANRVSVDYSVRDERYVVANVSVNFGPNSSYGREDTKEVESLKNAMIANGTFWLEGSTLYAGISDAGVIFYTVDFTGLIPEGWVVSLTHIGGRLREIGLAMAHPEFSHTIDHARILSNDDLHEPEETICGEPEPKNFLSKGENRICQRGANHLGNHQAFDKDLKVNWNRGGSGRSHLLPFGLKASCSYCGEVRPGPLSGIRTCSTCEYWLEQAAERKASFVIEGTHYRPGKGGFGGTVFTVERLDGTMWKGELFTQGAVPSWMRNIFPDTARFVPQGESQGTQNHKAKPMAEPWHIAF